MVRKASGSLEALTELYVEDPGELLGGKPVALPYAQAGAEVEGGRRRGRG